MAAVSLNDVKTHLNITSTGDDAEILGVLDAAVDVVEGIVGPITSSVVTETHYGVSAGVLVLRRFPATALTAVSSRAGADVLPLTLSDYELDPETGIVRAVSGGWFSGTYVVTYTAGYAALPPSVRLAVLVIAKHLWETQRGPANGPLQDEPAFTPGLGFAIPNRAKELLAPYALGPTLA